MSETLSQNNALDIVLDAAQCYLDDLESGTADGTYDVEQVVRIQPLREAIEALRVPVVADNGFTEVF